MSSSHFITTKMDQIIFVRALSLSTDARGGLLHGLGSLGGLWCLGRGLGCCRGLLCCRRLLCFLNLFGGTDGLLSLRLPDFGLLVSLGHDVLKSSANNSALELVSPLGPLL